MVMISLSTSPGCGPRFLAGWASSLSSRASQCGRNAWQKSSNWQKSSTSRSNIDASPRLMAPTQKAEFKGDKGLASPQTRNSGYICFEFTQQAANLQRDRSRRRSCPGHGVERRHGFSDELEAASDLSMPEPPADPLDGVRKARACFAILCRDVRPTLGRLGNMLDTHRKVKPVEHVVFRPDAR